jgi:hypothetical protein
MAGLDPATHAARHHRPMRRGSVTSRPRWRLSNRVGGRIKSGHDDMLLVEGMF